MSRRSSVGRGTSSRWVRRQSLRRRVTSQDREIGLAGVAQKCRSRRGNSREHESSRVRLTPYRFGGLSRLRARTGRSRARRTPVPNARFRELYDNHSRAGQRAGRSCPLARLIRPNASSRDPSATEHVEDRVSRHIEFRANASQRQAGLVQLPGSIEVDIGAVPNLSAGSSDDRGCGPIDLELGPRARSTTHPPRTAERRRIVANQSIWSASDGAMGRVDGTPDHALDQRERSVDAPRCRGWSNDP